MKKLSTLSVVMASVLASSNVMAEVSANIGAMSNYLWRGVTQTSDASSVSGGIDYAHKSGLYAGLWTAGSISWTANPGDTETDSYLGFSGEDGGMGYNIGYIMYDYYDDNSDFSEVYAGISMGMFGAKYSLDSENSNSYIEVSADFELPSEFGMGLHFGSYALDTGTDYTDYSIAFSKGDFSLSLSDTSENVANGMSDNLRYAVSWGASF